MIPEVTEETLETMKEQLNRGWGEYACRINDNLVLKQPELLLWIKLTAEMLMDDMGDQIIGDSEEKLQIQTKIVSAMMIMVQSIYNQQEINELKEELV